MIYKIISHLFVVLLFFWALTVFFYPKVVYASIPCSQESYTQCGTSNTACPSSQQWDSSYYVHINYSNSSPTTCNISCSGSHVLGQCNWTGCTSGHCINGETGTCGSGYIFSSNQNDQEYCTQTTYHGACCIPQPSQSSGAPNASCGQGNNNGADNGTCGTDSNVYYCYQGIWHLKTTCSNGCQVNPGIADTCSSSGNSSGNGNGNNNTNPTATPIPDNSASTPTPTPTIVPTATPIPPSPTPSGPPLTTADVTIHVEGIDSTNIPNISSHLARHGQSGWPFTIYVYTQNQSLSSTPYQVYTDTLQEIQDPSSPFYGFFQNKAFKLYNSHSGLPSGMYKFVVRTPVGSLRKQIGSQAFSIAAWTNNVLVPVDPTNPNFLQIPQLVMGDLNGDNAIDIIDLNILIDCYGQKRTQNACLSDKNNIVQSFSSLFTDFLPGDLSDSGIVDGVDFNILFKNFNLQGN